MGIEDFNNTDLTRLSAGNITMQTAQWTVTVSDRPIQLTYLEFRLLQELMLARGSVLTRETLLQRIWGYDNTSLLETRTVDAHMGRLRRKLGEASKHVLTVRNVGYRMAISPNWLSEHDDD